MLPLACEQLRYTFYRLIFIMQDAWYFAGFCYEKKGSNHYHVFHLIAGINGQNVRIQIPKMLLTVGSDSGASKDLLSICTVALQCSAVLGEVPQWQYCVWGVDGVWQASIDGSVVQCPEDFATDTWSLTHYLGIRSHFDVLIFRGNIAGFRMLTCRKL